MNLCACLGDLNLPINFSRFRVGRWDPSVRLFMLHYAIIV